MKVLFSVLLVIFSSVLGFGQEFDIVIDTSYNISQIDEVSNANTEDFFVIPTMDTSLIISSDRGQKDVQPDFFNQKRYESIWISYKKDGKEWAKPRPLRFEDNIADISAVGYSTNGKYFIIYQGAWQGGDIMIAEDKDEKPVRLQPLSLSINNSKESSGFLDMENSKLYFTSDRDGGKGGLDIWVADIDEDFECSNIKNIDILNTDKNEHSIWLRNDTIWFASQGHFSYGGFDIFYSVKTGNGWSEPKNMGINVNTVADEISFSPVVNTWCSTRGEKGTYNVFMYEINIDTTKVEIEDTVVEEVPATKPIVNLNEGIIKNINTIREQIGEEIDYCMVQLIAYNKETPYDISAEVFKRVWNIVDYDLVKSNRIIKGKKSFAFVLDRKFYDENHLAIEQAVEYKREFISKHPEFDYKNNEFKPFINVYTVSGKRKIIFFDEKKLIYVLVSE
jgi:hypothetical protein